MIEILGLGGEALIEQSLPTALFKQKTARNHRARRLSTMAPKVMTYPGAHAPSAGVPYAPTHRSAWVSHKPMTRHEKIVASVLAILIIATTFLSFGTEFVGYPKVGGLSMEPTIHQPLYIPFGDPSIRHRGAFVHINQTIDPTVGSIVMFRHGSDRDVKRIDKIRGDSAVWVIADNVGVTGMDSREYGWIPADNIIGVVDRIITPRRIVRSLTKEGRWWNAMEMSFGSLHRVTENYVVVNNHDGNTYLCSPNTELLLGRSNRGSNATPSLRGNRLAVPLADGVAVVDLTVGSAKVVPANRVAMARWLDDSHVCIRMLMGVNDPSSIVEVGS